MSPSATRRKATEANAAAAQRIEVRKTYKLYIGGAFPRSESGRTYEVTDSHGRFLANTAMGSRKDARDAVVAARGAFATWAAATAYNRGQVLYRVAELMEGRRAQFAAGVAAAEGALGSRGPGGLECHRPVGLVRRVGRQARPGSRWRESVAAYFNISAPEPTGVVAVLAPQRSSLLGLVLCPGPDRRQRQHGSGADQRTATTAGCDALGGLANSDVPAGVINVITGRTAEVAPWLAAHQDVNAIDLAGAAGADDLG